MKISWKLGLLVFVICSIAVVPALDSAVGKDIATTYTPTFNDAFSVSGQDGLPTDIEFNADGTKMFVVGWVGKDVNEYACTTGFDVSTCSFTDAASVSGQEETPEGIAFNTAGTKMFITGTAGDDVNEYTLGTGFDISDNLTFVDAKDISGQETEPRSLTFNADGTKMFIVGDAGDL